MLPGRMQKKDDDGVDDGDEEWRVEKYSRRIMELMLRRKCSLSGLMRRRKCGVWRKSSSIPSSSSSEPAGQREERQRKPEPGALGVSCCCSRCSGAR
eukprot:1303544-Rhodomonas_salina.1